MGVGRCKGHPPLPLDPRPGPGNMGEEGNRREPDRALFTKGMGSMPHTTGNLQYDGAVVDVVIQIVAAEVKQTASGGPTGPPAQTRQGDNRLRSTPHRHRSGHHYGRFRLGGNRREPLKVPGREVSLGIFLVDFSMTRKEGFTRSWNPLEVAGLDLTGFGASALIGIDVLANCRFVYDGKTNTLTIVLVISRGNGLAILAFFQRHEVGFQRRGGLG